MKKNLLIVLAVTLSISVAAQSRVKSRMNRVSAPSKIVTESAPKKATSISQTSTNVRRNTPGINQTNSATLISLGHNPNAFSCANNSRSNVAYNADINSVIFIHRGDPNFTGDGTVGFYRYDLSVDGGNTWTIDNGPIYQDQGGLGGRYPICGIYNPSGNTIADNAYLSVFGPWTDGSGFQGSVNAIGRLDGAGIAFSHTADLTMTFPDNMTIVKNTQEAWRIGNQYDVASGDFNFATAVSHGIWNSGSNDYDFTETVMPVETNVDNQTIVDSDIAFSDDGQTGYIAMIRNNDPTYAIWKDSSLYLTVFKSTDGGANWSSPIDIDMRSQLDSILGNDTSEYSSGFDLDAVVDMNGHLHILVGVFRAGGDFTISSTTGTWGMFDIYNDASNLWHAQILDKPLTFRGVFGDGGTDNPTLNEDSRPFACRSWDGSKLIFSWFDTDTTTFGSVEGNRFPDLHSIGFNVTTGLWTNAMNLTVGTPADGVCTFGNGAYYAIDQGSNVFSVPAVIQSLSDATATGQPTALNYINGANVDFATATNAGNPVLLGINPLIGISNPIAASTLSVTSNYPNPFSGKTTIGVNLTKAGDVTIEVSSLLGQVLSTSKYSNLNNGLHKLTIDASKFASGIYTYKVKAGNDVVTKKMVVQ